MVRSETRDGITTITLTPHLSADWPQVKRFMALIAAVVFMVAAAWTAAGIWLALPFAGVEVGLICYLMYRVCFRLSYLYQRVVIEPERVRVEQGVRGPPRREWLLRRPDAHLHLTMPVKEVDLMRLRLCDDHGGVELGAFLNGEGREAARQALRRAGLIETADRWWETARP
ncbi:DUF2244 domain-containing protein [Alloalcanivorax marinus]|uniref:DUF2244 domain-containing protein n=1 Tax=Alloalcanivorax marinus TaxID=1177169 RepID=UPI0019326C3C|nr:DUF2244 domain-containing protein [Alloalcanivorax marinus]MBL7248984.1 DUF2244 domain-containing protein [Alloalcanivorax marinus]